jgi:NMD protein affecting ribosome stability and mRNA decay
MPPKTNARVENYHQRLEQGLCPRCAGKVKKSSPYKYCDDCRTYFREYGTTITEKVRATRNRIYAQRKKHHQCPRCGKQLGKKYPKKLCPDCLAKAKQYRN